MSRRTGLACAPLVALLAAAQPAAASPLSDPFLGGVVFTGPTHAHPTSFYYNPAALGLDTGTHVFVAGTGRLDQLGIDRAPTDDRGAPGGAHELPATHATLLSPRGLAAVDSDIHGRLGAPGIAAATA